MQLHDISTAARLVHWPQMSSINTSWAWHLYFREAHMFKHRFLILSPSMAAKYLTLATNSIQYRGKKWINKKLLEQYWGGFYYIWMSALPTLWIYLQFKAQSFTGRNHFDPQSVHTTTGTALDNISPAVVRWDMGQPKE